MKLIDALKTLEGYHAYTEPKRLKRIVEKSARFLQEKGLDFDTIAVQGVSGLIVGSPLAMALDKKIMVVRKQGDKTHCTDVMGFGKNQKILMIDDCVETGATVINMVSKIKFYCNNPTFVGLFLYTGIRPNGFQYRCESELIDVITFPPSGVVGKLVEQITKENGMVRAID